MICGPCLGWHGPKVARRAFGPCWAVVLGLRPSTARPGKIPCLIGPARFSPKHDGSVPCRPGTAQLSALVRATAPPRQRSRNATAACRQERQEIGAPPRLTSRRAHAKPIAASQAYKRAPAAQAASLARARRGSHVGPSSSVRSRSGRDRTDEAPAGDGHESLPACVRSWPGGVRCVLYKQRNRLCLSGRSRLAALQACSGAKR